MTPSVWPALLAVLGLSTACAGSKMSAIQPHVAPAREIDRLAIAPGSSVLGDAIGLELFGFSPKRVKVPTPCS